MVVRDAGMFGVCSTVSYAPQEGNTNLRDYLLRSWMAHLRGSPCRLNITIYDIKNGLFNSQTSKLERCIHIRF